MIGENVKSALSVPTRVIRLLVFGFCTFLLFEFVSLYLSWPKQAVLGGLSLLVAIVLNRSSKSQMISLALMLLSMAATLRYGWWRVHMIVDYFRNESNHRISIDSLLMLILLSAEAYTVFIMVLGYMQTSFVLQRKPVPLPADEALWPHVDVLIPTYNEPLSLVRYTALAAINIDYPPDKLHVYILDDGTREDFRLFAEEAGVGYVTRVKHNHAKAGNINHALTRMSSPLVAIFDCDHVPTRSFLQMTAGWFLVDPRLAMLQTPHYFYSPDPFERNLLQYKSIPNEGELFYGIIQDGNDFWNASFFCGSCAVLRREALDEVGGIATETVTEDAHTSLRMQSRGWNTAYINVAQAAGLATETLAGHVGQRVRWARGMIQILRTDNPLLARGMKLTQRLCYFNAMMHFMYAVPRLIFLLSPLAYMILGRTIIPGYWIAILAYALPHLAISSLTNSRIQGKHRHSFWNEIYETVLAPFILLPTLLALINPKLGSFNVTDKGTTLEETRFDRRIAAPTTWLLLLNFVGVLVTPYRLFILDPQHPGVIISNLCWILFNMVILGVAAAVAHEQKQRRSAVRIPARIPILVQLMDGTRFEGFTKDMSVGGASIALSQPDAILRPGDLIRVAFPAQTGNAQISSTVIGGPSDDIRLQFIALSIGEQETLTRALYSRADSWIHGREEIEADRPLISLGRIVLLSFTGFKQVILGLFPRRQKFTAKPLAHSVSMLLLVLTCLPASRAGAQNAAGLPPLVQPAGTDTARITLEEMGVQGAAEMRGPHSYYSVHFTLAHTELPRSAALHLSYHFDRSLGLRSGWLAIRVNNTLVSKLYSAASPQKDDVYDVVTLPVSADQLVRDNEITFEFMGSGVLQSGEQLKSLVLARVGASSFMEIGSDPVPLSNDLSLLPLPLYDGALQTTATIPFVFLTQPDARTLQAAGVVASWFGVQAGSGPVRFTVSVGQIPRGNVVLFVNRSAGGNTALLPLAASSGDSPSLSIESNPSDPSGSTLIISGQDDDQLLLAAQALSMRKSVAGSPNGEPPPVEGPSKQISNFVLPAARKPDDAPRWLPGDHLVSLWNYSSPAEMQSDGSKPILVYLHVAPDLYYGETQNLRLRINYRYDSRPIATGSALRTLMNGALINEAPLTPGQGFTEAQRQVLLPVAEMRPFGNTLLFSFDFNPRLHSVDGQGSMERLQGALMKNSSLDLRGVDHWAAMPNLELFANAGFPFTQWADLGKTVVVLPVRPSLQEMAMFLNLMSHCGAQTGYPALRMEVTNPNDMVRDDRDYLVLGTVANQPAFAALQSYLPVPFGADGLQFRQESGYLKKINSLWQRMLGHNDEEDESARDSSMPSAIMEGLESPFASGHSVVVVALRDDLAEDQFTTAFLKGSQSSDISHSVTLLRDSVFTSFVVDGPTYHIGNVSAYTVMRIWLTEHFLLLLLAVSLCSLVLASWTFGYLKRRGAMRLSLANNVARPVAAGHRLSVH